MTAGPFRDSTPSLLRRIEELERTNLRLRRRARRGALQEIIALFRAICRLVAIVICVVGIMILAFVVLGFLAAFLACLGGIA